METEVKRLLVLGHWPQSSPDELRAHVAECRACGDLVLLTQAFGAARVPWMAAASPPPAGVLWWRAQLRRRDAAVRQLQRPLFGAQLFAFAVTLLILSAALTYEALRGMPSIAALNGWLETLKQSPAFRLDALWPFAAGQSSVSLMYVIPGLAMLLLLGGLVVYLAAEKQ